MTSFLWASTLFLLISLVVGSIRIGLGPTDADRMLSAQLFGTTGVSMLLLLAHTLADEALVDVALVFALLAVVAAVAFVRRATRSTSPIREVEK
jgi:multicomponent Na+:H+ antiporter subunit F